MHLLPRERDKILLHQVGSLAQKRLARGVRLNQTEATALIAAVLQERIRDGKHSVAELMQHGKTLLGRNHVLPGVESLLHEVMVEGTFHDGCFLVTVHDPICTARGNLKDALYGSFLPVPSDRIFEAMEDDAEGLSGAVVVKQDADNIVLSPGRERLAMKVTNTGDRPIQVGSREFIPFLHAILHAQDTERIYIHCQIIHSTRQTQHCYLHDWPLLAFVWTLQLVRQCGLSRATSRRCRWSR